MHFIVVEFSYETMKNRFVTIFLQKNTNKKNPDKQTNKRTNNQMCTVAGSKWNLPIAAKCSDVQ